MKKAPNTPSQALSSSAAHASQPLAGFQYARSQFEELVDMALGHAKKLGASDAGAEVSEGAGLSVSVRKGELENVERNRDKSLGVTVYLGQKRGNASTSDFSPDAIRQTVQAAYDIARFTAEDPVAGLPDPEDIADSYPDLDLFHPWAINSEDALRIALECEAAAFATSKKISNSEGAGVSAQQSHFFTAHMRGGERGRPGIFSGGYASSRHSLSVAPIAGKGANMQRDHWYSSMRAPEDLASPQAVGRYAAERALARLNGRKIATTECPVLFESPLAAGLLGGYVQATSGGALYRKTTFLADSLGKRVMAKHLDIVEDPHVINGKGSAPFDDEGVRTQKRKVLSAGKVLGYFLSTYSARKLGMRTTGNAGGSHNLVLTSRLTQPGDDLKAMIKKLGRGLFVTELMGQGVNYVTGDYSRGASGYWVENGEIAYPVHEITIAGNLKDMFQGIEAVGADAYNYGAKTVGSILVNRMKVAGS
ncbi:metalloprotease PmbA [Hydrogenophaga taeniospiralis]|uniref:metalloprotease PmbA n=1 Tax=Hydrogenophaga taeniospiralis TaxID=65656 RepID=UPI001CFAE652|nr:metalloprotease PmbA [Hydrogenophaga taeniospiralis]UCU92916.1 metalloprotease PmbA [Hydrogenophaga taeniospiralis]